MNIKPGTLAADSRTVIRSRFIPVLAALLATMLALPVNAAVEVPLVPPGSGNGIPPNILFIMDDSGSMSYPTMPGSTRTGNMRNNYSHKSFVHNVLHYNPSIDYQAWMNWEGERMTGGTTYSSAYVDSIDASDPIDLANSSSCGTSRENDNDQTVCGGEQVFFVPKDLSRTESAYLNNEDNYYRFTITENKEIRRSEHDTPGVYVETTPDRLGGGKRSVGDELDNYATWFSYHRTRVKSAKAGASEAFSSLDGERYRVGFDTIWNRIDMKIPVDDDNGLFRGENRELWFESLFESGSSSTTPLRRALTRAGNYFSDDDDDGPYGGDSDSKGNQFQCRQNFSILTTDGYWNGGNPSDIGNADAQDGELLKAPDNPDGSPGATYKYEPKFPYSGSDSVTLADVAMHFWKSDLRKDMDNIVPVTAANPAFWQHMVTFGISIGLTGTLDQSSVREVLEQGLSRGGVPRSDWPNPMDSENRDRIDDLLHAAVNGRGEFVAATDPVAFADGLKAALGAIANRTGSASNVAASSTSISTDTRLFQASYRGGDWTGELVAYPVTTGGINVANPVWRASDEIPGWNSRKIYTTDASGSKGAFPTTLQDSQLGAAGPAHSPSQFSIAEYIEGNDAGEMRNGGVLRSRIHPMGDIVHSSPYYVKDTDTVYVGANDGMLHAFNAANGREVFAYVPRGVDMGKLRELASPDYGHRYYVDGPVVVSERSQTITTDHPTGRNILVGTLGRGGKGVFGLDVTGPTGFGSSDVLFDIVGDDDMGLVTGAPFVAKLNDGSVSAIFGNGINSDNESAVLYIVNVDNGSVTKIDTEVDGDNGLSAPRGWDSDGDGAVDLVYAGDQLGNLWKFDLSDKNKGKWEVALGGDPLFTATDAGGNPQHISGGISIGIDPVGYQRWVFFGTGRLLNDDDLWEDDGDPNLDVQTLYGIIDDGSAIGTREDNDSPSQSDGLVKRTIKATGSIDGKPVRSFESSVESIPLGKRGWFIDLLTPPGTAEGERIIGNPQVVGPVLVTSSIIPGSDPCIPGGRGYINALNAFTGASVGSHFFDVDGDGQYTDDSIGDDPVGSVDTGVGMNTDGVLIDKLIGVGGSSGSTGSVGVRNPASSGRISWRELLKD